MNERRRALLPPDVSRLRHADKLLFETRYGEVMGYSDDDYRRAGAQIVSRADAFSQPIVCNPKPVLAEESALFDGDQTLFGWIHAVQNRDVVDFLLAGRHSALAWEDMYDRGRHVFWRNNEIAGEVGVWHALIQWGRTADGCRVAVLGRGNVARGAVRILDRLGARVTIFSRQMEQLFRDTFDEFHVIGNAVLWDVLRADRLLWRGDPARLKPGFLIVDLSCDEGPEIETSRATAITDPTFVEQGVVHYAVDHTPALVWKSASESISAALAPYVDVLVEERAAEHAALGPASVIKDGVILDERINRHQGR